jgi:hypothetical protein
MNINRHEPDDDNHGLVACWPVIKQDVGSLYFSDTRAMQTYMRSNGSSNTKWESGDSDNEAFITSGFPIINATVEEYFNE